MSQLWKKKLAVALLGSLAVIWAVVIAYLTSIEFAVYDRIEFDKAIVIGASLELLILMKLKQWKSLM